MCIRAVAIGWARVLLRGVGLDIGDAAAEPGDAGHGEGIVIAAAAHEIDCYVDRLELGTSGDYGDNLLNL